MIDITFPESTLQYCSLQCNSARSDYTACPEVLLIADFLASISRPKNCLDIGSGIGRVSVFLHKSYAWPGTKYWLLDGDSGTTQIAGMNYTPSQAFYNSMQATKDFCQANGLANFETINISASPKMPNGLFDLCYSCKAIGFHWPLKDYLDLLGSATAPNAHLFLELRSKKKICYKEETRWTRACKFTDWQLDQIKSDKRYKLLDCRDNGAIFIAIVQRS